MRPRHTHYSDPNLAGPTTQTAIRIPTVQREAVRAAIEAGLPGLHSFTDVVVDALWLWLFETDWASVPTEVTVPANTQEANAQLDAEWTGQHDSPRPDSNGRPAWKDVDTALIEDS